MFDNEGNEYHCPMVEGYDYFIRGHSVVGRLRLLNEARPMYQLEFLYIGSCMPDEIDSEGLPFLEVRQILYEAQKLARITSGHEGFAAFSSMTFHWPE